MSTIILGGGIAGLSLAYFLDRKTIILEKNKKIGGLSRSFDFNGIACDVGPHIMFSKNKEILDLHLSFVETNKLKRISNVLFKGKFIQYPFENGLGKLDPEDRDYCLKEFLNNPYEDYEAKNMLQFFLKTFGEGITRLYLQPYNEKIWKLDPSCLDTQMVERIPKPPKKDIINSAKGKDTEGYLHQLYFHYPKKEGFQSLVNAYADRTKDKCQIINPIKIEKISKKGKDWEVKTDKKSFTCNTLVNCMPIHELFKYIEATKEVTDTVNKLKYNSIYIVGVQAKKDKIGNKVSINVADKSIIFHRISKLNFLGDAYCLKDGGITLQLDITFRPNSYLASLGETKIKERVVNDLVRLDLVKKDDVTDVVIRKFKYAYPIYDLDHRKNTDFVLNYLRSIGIECTGRFAEFEYMNTDKVAEHSQNLAKKLNAEGK